jgi:hypothetical protein
VETFDARGPSLERMFVDDDFPDRNAMRQAARAELRELRAAAATRSSPTSDPLEHLSAAETGQDLGLHEQSVRTSERAGQLFSIPAQWPQARTGVLCVPRPGLASPVSRSKLIEFWT